MQLIRLFNKQQNPHPLLWGERQKIVKYIFKEGVEEYSQRNTPDEVATFKFQYLNSQHSPLADNGILWETCSNG